MGALPFLSGDWFTASAATTRLIYFSGTWFKHYSTTIRDHRTNYFHLLGATSMVRGGTQLQGETIRESNFTYIFQNRIETYGGNQSAGSDQISFLSQRNTTHEFGHQFGVNLCNSGDGHDTRNAWCTDHCEPGLTQMRDCIMKITVPTNPDDWDGYDRFCTEDLFQGCAGPSSPGEHAIRTEQEPVKVLEAGQ